MNIMVKVHLINPIHLIQQRFKLDVLNYIKETGASIRKAVSIFNIATHSTIQKWQKSFKLLGMDVLKSTKMGRPPMKKEANKPQPLEGLEEALRAENERLSMENAYLKKLHALIQERKNYETGQSANNLRIKA